jgi:hypothetical protein
MPGGAAHWGAVPVHSVFPIQDPLMSTAPRRHQWHLAFDRIVCRDCGVSVRVAELECKGATRIRPQAAIRQQKAETA